MELGKNVTCKVEGSVLTITIDLAKSFGRSASGKSTIIASTGGNQAIPFEGRDVKLGLNCYTK